MPLRHDRRGEGGLDVERGQSIIQLLVDKKWTTETITSLGGGHLYHLSYPVAMIEPKLLADLRNNVVTAGTEMEVVFRTSQERIRVALTELEKFTDFGSFVRLEFRLLQTPPSLKELKYQPENGYLLQYKKS
ncbi:MAG: hypothetical protein GX050_04905 [Firmicutes bacterium]|nr:hypothetical protein [Bacillota bacterium]